MTVFAEHEHLGVRIEDVVGEIGALVFLVTDVLIHLELIERRPFALNALGRHLRATLGASVTTT